MRVLEFISLHKDLPLVGRKIRGQLIGRGKTGAERGSLAEFRANLACLETVAQVGSDPVESGVLVRSGFLLS